MRESETEREREREREKKKIEREKKKGDKKRDKDDKHEWWRCLWGDSWLVSPPGWYLRKPIN